MNIMITKSCMFAGVVARVVTEPVEVSSPCVGGWVPRESTRQALGRARRDLVGLFESLLAQSFDGGQ